MDTSWWPALLAVVVLALVVAVADGRKRSSRRPPGRTRPSGRAPGRTAPGTGTRPADRPARSPRAGEIWWADVPFEDGPGSKDRPCLVLAVRGDSALVAKITSRCHAERPGVIALPPGAVGDARGRPSFLETDELRDVPLAEFRRRAGTADPVVWDQVRHLAR
ncbi:type II toxin-antitoxin system PemK/MazF family toxin [Streptomyces sp.]|uniref:type II toxin-antitoxin system PemK/MazF family toxin n=1 Tax=Streptomyces sp. TaxID=1931 RepID=UPI002811054C|nr:type II toxin-antitoxin system PemK/MazF family toxin [Streptomyces sp.]